MTIFQNTSGKTFYHPVTNRQIKTNEVYEGAAHMDHENAQVVQPEVEEVTEDSSLADMDPEELKVYAEKNGIDLGNATSKNGILKKIQASESGDPE